MDHSNHFSLLEMIERPAFCVCDGCIIRANKAAQQKLFVEGASVIDFLSKDGHAYQAFTGGCLYLNITSSDVTCGASVTRIEDFDLFILDTEGAKLEAYALAAVQLKTPLCGIVNVIEELAAGDRKYEDSADNLRQHVYQLSRLVSNMADADWLRQESSAKLEVTEFSGFFAELMEKMETLIASTGKILKFQNLTEATIGLADRALLERAISNILSNAVKFSPNNSIIHARITKNANFLYVSVTDSGDCQELRCNVFTNYMRSVGIEDSRHGLGLGMAIVHSVATDHGGTVLVDTPETGGTRVTMSISLRRPKRPILRSPTQLPKVDLVSGIDPAFVEFADVLPASAFEIKK